MFCYYVLPLRCAYTLPLPQTSLYVNSPSLLFLVLNFYSECFFYVFFLVASLLIEAEHLQCRYLAPLLQQTLIPISLQRYSFINCLLYCSKFLYPFEVSLFLFVCLEKWFFDSNFEIFKSIAVIYSFSFCCCKFSRYVFIN